MNVSLPLWAADPPNEATCAVPPLCPPLSPAVLLSPLKSDNSAFGWSGKLSAARWGGKRGEFFLQRKDIILYILDGVRITALGLFKVFSLQAKPPENNIFWIPPKLPLSPLPSPPSLHASHQAGVELSERFVIMSTQSTPTLTNYQHSQVTLLSCHNISFTREGTLQNLFSFLWDSHEKFCF